MSPHPRLRLLAGVLTGLLARAVLLMALSACSLLREPLPTPAPTSVAHVTADQVAQAMDDDNFYNIYGHTTLLVQGVVAALDQQPNHLTVSLATGVRTKVACDLGSASPAVKIGDTLTVRSADPENDVTRQDAAVVIKNCTIAATS